MAHSRQGPLGGFDLVSCLRKYVDKMVDEKGLKILLTDNETQAILSTCVSFNEILQKDLYLIDLLGSPKRQRQGHLKAIVFVRPTEENVALLAKELKSPLYAEYMLYFSNVLPIPLMNSIAMADEQELVKSVHECYGDYYPLHPHLFTCDFDSPMLEEPSWMEGGGRHNNRAVDAILATMLSIRRRPIIRYQGNSSVAQRLARDVQRKMDGDKGLFDFRKGEDCVLLIVDRKDDPVTPLLHQWTYEAMVHQEFGIRNHRCTFGKDDQELNLTPLFDTFWSENMYRNWGDLCENVKSFVDNYKAKSNLKEIRDSATSNLDDLKRFMEKIPELRREGLTMTKHAGLAAELGKVIRERHLLEVSLLEQDMACNSQHKEHAERLRNILLDCKVHDTDALKLVMLYALRYERNTANRLTEFKDILSSRGVDATLVSMLLAYAGETQRASDLFGQERSILGIMKSAVKGIQDVDNLYTQHEPLIKKTVSELLKGRLNTTSFPFVGQEKTAPNARLKEVVVFMVGGACYEESKAIKEFQTDTNTTSQGRSEQRWPGCKVIMGTTSMIRPPEFLDALRKLKE